MGLHERNLNAVRYLSAFARGRDESWEAFCLDFDLAVQGNSLEEVRGLEDAIAIMSTARNWKVNRQDRGFLAAVRPSSFACDGDSLFRRHSVAELATARDRRISGLLPRLKCTFREFITILERHGFIEVRDATGSHRRFRGETAGETRFVTVAYHNINDQVLTGTLQSMIRQSVFQNGYSGNSCNIGGFKQCA